MKCKSCNEDIESRMKKALAANECPYCGGNILDKESMRQLLDLNSVLESQRFTDSPEHDKRIKEKVVRVLMEYMKCIKIKEIKHDEDIVKLNEKTPLKNSVQVVPGKDVVTEQKKMRNEIYAEVYREQYGAEPTSVNEDDIIDAEERVDKLSPEDIEAAKDVVFSNVDNPDIADKVDRLRRASKGTGGNKPITRIS